MVRNDLFCWPVRVYIEDTDTGGIVYHANYLKYFERARTEYLRANGFPRIETIDPNSQFVVHRINVVYHNPARLDMLLNVSATVAKLGRTYIEFSQSIYDDNKAQLVEAEVIVACIGKKSFRPQRLPENLRNTIEIEAAQ